MFISTHPHPPAPEFRGEIQAHKGQAPWSRLQSSQVAEPQPPPCFHYIACASCAAGNTPPPARRRVFAAAASVSLAVRENVWGKTAEQLEPCARSGCGQPVCISKTNAEIEQAKIKKKQNCFLFLETNKGVNLYKDTLERYKPNLWWCLRGKGNGIRETKRQKLLNLSVMFCYFLSFYLPVSWATRQKLKACPNREYRVLWLDLHKCSPQTWQLLGSSNHTNLLLHWGHLPRELFSSSLL